MNLSVQSEDLAEVTNVVGRHANGGAKISDVVEALAATRHMPPSKARFVVRVALDKGKVRTDCNFRLHLTSRG
jgi:hypothetical protein